jgi:asparagine synthase (glutamine-hydrolysing)
VVRSLHNRFEAEIEQDAIRAALTRSGSAPAAAQLTTLFQLGYHLRTLLHRNDCMGMAASIEARFPFLDTRVVRLGVNMPYRVKARPSLTALESRHLFIRDKWVLRKVAERYLPAALAWQKKVGFPIGATARMHIAPELFEDSFVADLFELGSREVRFLVDHAGRDLTLRLLYLDVWGRVCLEGASTDDVTRRLQKYVTLR